MGLFYINRFFSRKGKISPPVFTDFRRLLFLATLLITTNAISQTNPSLNNTNIDTLRYLNLLAVGDLMCQVEQVAEAKDSSGSYDFTGEFRFVKKYFDSADIAFGNFETVTGGKDKRGYTGFPYFNAPDQYLAAIKWCGFTLLSTANNHALDRGEKGILRTAHVMDSLGFARFGAFVSQRDRDSVRIIEKNNFRLAFLGYSYSDNGNTRPEGKEYLLNLIDTALIRNDIAAAKLLKPDLIIVYYHWGNEYQSKPSDFQKKLARWTFKQGATIILASHPHVLQTIERVPLDSTASLDTGLVLYSLGNFVSNQRGKENQTGAILRISLVKNMRTNAIRFGYVGVIPTWIHSGKYNGKQHLTVLPISGIIDSTITDFKFSNAEIRNFKAIVAGSKKLLLKNFTGWSAVKEQ